VLTDRFENGDSSNDKAYGRGLVPPPVADEPRGGFFHGGDLAGLTDRLRKGYFDSLGVDVIWISSPFEQIHGYVGGGPGDHRSYGYHGYWSMDYTALDSSLGFEADLEEFVRESHRRHIRVVLDAPINHPGYHTLQDMASYEFATPLPPEWSTWTPGADENWHGYHDEFVDYTSGAEAWSRWWGPSWIRAGLPGYSPCGTDDATMCLSSLPDFRTEAPDTVAVPAFLVAKWGTDKSRKELVELAQFFRSRGLAPTVRNHLVKWLTDWIRRYGIDGFRIDAARHLDLATIGALRAEADRSYAEWKAAHPDEVVDERGFWMTCEVFGHGVERSSYHDAGLNSVINFSLQHDLLRRAPIDSIYSAYSEFVRQNPGQGILSFISSHDTRLFPRDRLAEAATRLMLLPGGVQTFYGDETGRPEGRLLEDTDEHTRSPMNWSSVDADVLGLWRTLGIFRKRHPAVALGVHEKLSESPYSFRRSYRAGAHRDEIIAVIGAQGKTRLNVSAAFEENALLRDAITGRISLVSFGMVALEADESGVMLLEAVDE
jgi:alpha-amylase